MVFAIAILLPLSSIFFSFADEPGSGWNYIFDSLIYDYSFNTIVLAIGVSVCALLFSVLPAWFVANYKFPLSGVFRWALVLPLSIPTYIIAFIYGDVFSFGGEFYSIFYSIFGLEISTIYFDIFKIYYLIPILASVLYPYVYLTALDSFENGNRNFIESAKVLGKSNVTIFKKVALPLSRPAIASGLFLVNMELLNDYGAMDYFGVQTFTTGVFRTWFGMNDLPTALRLALILFTIAFVFIYIEKLFRKRAKYYEEGNNAATPKVKIYSAKKWLMLTVCLVPVLIGFVIPIMKLVYNAIDNISKIDIANYLSAVGNTATLSIMTALTVVVVSISIVYSERTNKFPFVQKLLSLATVGYAIPGAIIAVSMLYFLSGINNSFGLFAFGSVFVLVYAYNIRFMATGYSPIKSISDKNGTNSYESAKLMGYSDFKTFTKVEWNAIKPAMLTGLLVTFVEVLKELPLTLILRPFDYDTVATIAYQYAKNEMVKEASIYSLTIVIISMLPIFLLVKSKNKV